MRQSAAIILLVPLSILLDASTGCGNDNPPPYNGAVEQTGQACANASQCFADVDAGALQGTAICLTQVQNGYCTHTCQSDSNCCAVPGECRTAYPQVCSPYTSTSDKYCFLSCEDSDVQAAGYTDATLFCHTFANVGLTCKSSGGGSQNRKICMP